MAEVGARPLRGTIALAKTPKTPKTPRNVPRRCFAPRIGLLGQRASLSPWAFHATVSQCLRSSYWPGSAAWLAMSWRSWESWRSWSARWKMESLAGGPATGRRQSLRTDSGCPGAKPAARGRCLAKTPRTPKTPRKEWPVRSAFHSLVICRREAAPRSRPCRILAVLGVLGVLAARHPMKFLAGGPATGMWHSPCGRPSHQTIFKNFLPPPCVWSADLLSLRRQQTGRALARSATTSCFLREERKKE